MTKLSKKQKAAQELYDKNKVYNLEEAVDVLKNAPRAKFDETVELSLNLSLDSKNPSEAVRGAAVLPYGTGKNIRILVFCKDEEEEKAKKEGAEYAGAGQLIKKVQDGWCDFDVAIAETSMMREIAKLGKVLGPRGLMPNPKTGTVTDDITKTLREIKKGKIEFKMDKQGGIHVGVGKISFSKEAISENVRKLLDAIFLSNPNLNRPQTVKSATLSITMGPGLKLDISAFRK